MFSSRARLMSLQPWMKKQDWQKHVKRRRCNCSDRNNSRCSNGNCRACTCRPPYASLLASKCQPMGWHLEASREAYGGRHVQALQLPLLHLLLFLSLQLQRLLFTCFCQSCFFIQGCRDISLAREENIYFSLSLEESWAVRLFSHELFLFLPSD